MEIIPAIMQRTLEGARAQVSRVKDHVPLVQLDVMDGVFVPHTSWPYGDEKHFQKLVREKTGLPFSDEIDYEVDLMVKEPEHVIEDWMHLGVRRLIVHIESTNKIENIISDVAAHITRAHEELEVVSLGLAVNTTTSVQNIVPHLSEIEFVQCMGIAEIGKQGQPFDERVITQIEKLKKLRPELIISVDGGVNLETIERLHDAGATRFAAGSAILNSEDPAGAIRKLQESL